MASMAAAYGMASAKNGGAVVTACAGIVRNIKAKAAKGGGISVSRHINIRRYIVISVCALSRARRAHRVAGIAAAKAHGMALSAAAYSAPPLRVI